MRNIRGQFVKGESYNKTHGLTETRFYHVFEGLNQRCVNSLNPAFKNYGNRGIKCEWSSFIEFSDDMYESYLEHAREFSEKNTTIERINNDGNYCKENCRWATRKLQNRNKRNTILFEYGGEKKTLPEWAELYGMKYLTLYMRIHRYKYTLDKALNTVVSYNHDRNIA